MEYMSVADRLNLMIDFAHSRGEDPFTNVVLARKASEHLATPVTAETIEAVRTGRTPDLSHELAEALCRPCGLSTGNYLTLPANHPEVQTKVEQFQMLITARDLGVQHIAARDTSNTISAITRARDQLRQMTEA